MAEALYRKYRPQTFDDVVGQEHIERTLKNALEQDKVSHAYLFCGPRGTGKTTTARLLAKALLCEHGPTSSPDGTCQDCLDIADGVHPDVYELDAASRTGVENVRDEIIGRVNYAPTRGRYKVYIIDEVHMLSMAAFNALLKTLEEPPEHVVFILCTTDPQKVPETIHSRCQRFDFHRLSNDEIVARLGAVCVAEGVEFEPEALELVAHRAEGGMRNALTSLEQLIAFGGGAVTVSGAEDLLGALDSSDMAEIMNAVGRRDVAACFNWTAQYVESGSDLAQFCRDMAQRVRDLYVLSLTGSDAALDVQEAELREMTAELELFGPDRLARMMAVLGDVLSDLRSATNPRLCFEIALTRMVRPESDLTLASLAERIEALELKTPSVFAAAPAQVQAQPTLQPAQTRPAQPQFAQTQPVQQREVPAREASPSAVSTQSATRQPSAIGAQSAPQQPSANSVQSAAPQPSASAVPSQTAEVQQPVSNAQTPASAASDLSALISNEAALQRTWRSVVNAIKKEKTAYGALLVSVVARPDSYGGIGLEFPAGNSFAYDMAQRPELKGAITKAFREVTGMDVPFTVNRAAASASAPAPSAPQASSAPQPHAKPRQRDAEPRVAPTTTRPQAAAPVQSAPSQAVPTGISDDEVPLDIYDTVAAPDDTAVPPWEEPAAVQAPAKPQSSEQPAQSAPVTSNPAANQDEASRLGAMASEIFGTQITFKEV